VAIVVDRSACVRCGACASVAPAVFAVNRRGVEVLAQPSDDRQHVAVRAALLLCPARAIAEQTP
jgi:ferredoxin